MNPVSTICSHSNQENATHELKKERKKWGGVRIRNSYKSLHIIYWNCILLDIHNLENHALTHFKILNSFT